MRLSVIDSSVCTCSEFDPISIDLVPGTWSDVEHRYVLEQRSFGCDCTLSVQSGVLIVQWSIRRC